MKEIKIIKEKVRYCIAAVIRRLDYYKQTTYIYCKCGNELISDDCFIDQYDDKNGDNHVLYKCKKCGRNSDWNFTIAPVPISWETINRPNAV